MLWAIDVGNTQTVVGRWDGEKWVAAWRLETDRHRTSEELAIQLKVLCDLSGLPFQAEGAALASVVPAVNSAIIKCFCDWLKVDLKILERGDQVGLTVTYDPPHAVGADRIANALGALALHPAPIVVVDFGTATTFDVIDAEGRYAGGAILPGVRLTMEALASRTAKLPSIGLRVPDVAIGRNTVQALESGLMWGAAGAVEEILRRIREELEAEPTAIATGGLGAVFIDLCPSLHSYEPSLTLDGIRIAWEKFS